MIAEDEDEDEEEEETSAAVYVWKSALLTPLPVSTKFHINLMPFINFRRYSTLSGSLAPHTLRRHDGTYPSHLVRVDLEFRKQKNDRRGRCIDRRPDFQAS